MRHVYHPEAVLKNIGESYRDSPSGSPGRIKGFYSFLLRDVHGGTVFKDMVPFSSTKDPLKGREVAVLTQHLCFGLLHVVSTVHGFSLHLD